jgi:AraC-like DNA-binding protein
MVYSQFKPHADLTNYIDAYWTVKGDKKELTTEKILPDGCVDLIFNLGEDCTTDNGKFTMKTNKTYLVGTMTRFKETNMNLETRLIGIRFKPAAFSTFYKFSSLHEVTDTTVDFESILSPDVYKTIKYSTAYLDQFLLKRLALSKHNLFNVIADIQYHKGQINVQNLAKRQCTTIRQLERSFKTQLGISPKEYIKLVRFQFAFELLKNKSTDQSLLDIAVHCGYYDHAHLTNEIKYFTGTSPSKL